MRYLTTNLDDSLQQRIKESTSDLKALEEMSKDLHLIRAALATDQIIVSLDQTAESLFDTVSKSVREIRSVRWINPEKTRKELITWLEDGANID